MKKIFCENRCTRFDVIRRAIVYLQKLENEEESDFYCNDTYAITVEIIDNNK